MSALLHPQSRIWLIIYHHCSVQHSTLGSSLKAHCPRLERDWTSSAESPFGVHLNCKPNVQVGSSTQSSLYCHTSRQGDFLHLKEAAPLITQSVNKISVPLAGAMRRTVFSKETLRCRTESSVCKIHQRPGFSTPESQSDRGLWQSTLRLLITGEGSKSRS